MIINKRKYYSISAQGRGGVSLSIALTARGFQNLKHIFDVLQSKTQNTVEQFTIYDLWDKKTEIYTVKNNKFTKIKSF